MRNIILLLSAWLIVQTVSAQKLVFFNAKKLPETVNSELDETLPILSSDGKTLYFVRSGLSGGKGGEDIWYSTRTSTGWTEAQNDLKNLNNRESNFIIGISRENNRLYLRNAYDKQLRKVISVAGSNYENGEWQEPYSIPALPELGFKGKHYSMYISHNEKYLFISMNIPGSNGQEDLYLLTRKEDGSWSTPFHLAENINSKGVEFAPFITEDGKYLFFASDGHGGFGDMDIFMSERLDESYQKWSDPMNLGININSKGFDAYFHVAHDNTIFYSSTRGDAQYEDIYTSEMHIFEKKKRTVIIHDLDNIEITEQGSEKKFKFVTLPSMREYLITHRNDTMITGDLSEYEYDIIFQLDSNSQLEEKLMRLKELKGYETLEELFVDNKILSGEHIDFDNLDAALHILEELEEAAAAADSTAIDTTVVEEVTPSTPTPPTVDAAIFKEQHIIYFDLNGSELTSEQRKKLTEFIAKGKGQTTVKLSAYTCDLGSYSFNKQLSNTRLNAVEKATKLPENLIKSKFEGQLKGENDEERTKLRKVVVEFIKE